MSPRERALINLIKQLFLCEYCLGYKNEIGHALRTNQAPVVQKLDRAIARIKQYPADKY